MVAHTAYSRHRQAMLGGQVALGQGTWANPLLTSGSVLPEAANATPDRATIAATVNNNKSMRLIQATSSFGNLR